MAINLGDINFGLGADTSRLARARQTVLAFGQAVNRAAAAQGEGARAAEAAMRRQEKALVDALNKTTKLNASIRETANAGQLLTSTTATYNRLAKELGNGRVNALQFQRSMEDFNTSIGRTDRQLRAIQATNSQQEQTVKAVGKALDQQAKYTNNVGRATFQAQQQVERFNATVARVGAPASISSAATAAQSQFQSRMAMPNLSAGQIQAAQQQFQASMQKAMLELRKFQAEANKTAASGLEGMLRRASDMAILLHGPLSGIATRLTLISSLAGSTTIAMAAMTVGASAAAFAVLKLGQAAVETAKVYERLNETMKAVTGSQAIASAELRYAQEVATRAGATFDVTATQYGRLMAAAKGTNLEGEQTRIIFENLTFSAQKLGMSSDNLAGVLRAVEQIMSKGKVQAEELRGQLGDRLPGAVQVMAQALGVTTQKLDEMMKKGKLTSDVLVKFAQTYAQRLGIDVSQAINTVVAAENRASNSFQRMNKAIDDAVGFSTAYKNSLNLLTKAMDWLAVNLTTVGQVFGAVAGSIAAALLMIYGPSVIAGFASLITMIRGLSTAIATLNFAMLLNPMVAFLGLLARVAALAAGAIGGFYAMGAAVGGTATAHDRALPAVQAYITAQGNLQSSIRATTAEYIKQQEVFAQGIQMRIRDLEAQRAGMQATLSAGAASVSDPMGTGFGAAIQQSGMTREIQELDTQLVKLREDAVRAGNDLTKLNEIMARQATVEQQRRNAVNRAVGGAGGSGEKSRAQIAIETANQDITRLKRELEILSMPPGMQGWAKMMDEVTKKVEDFREKLDKAKVPAAEAARLTDQYRQSLERLSIAKYNLEQFPPLWNTIVNVMSQGFDTGLGKLVDDIADGKNALQSLGETAKNIVKQLIKEFLMLWALNPFKNWLFGGNPATGNLFPTLGGFGGGGGGFLGGLFGGFGGLFGGGGSTGTGWWAKGGAFTNSVVSNPTLFGSAGGGLNVMGEKGDEAVMPLIRDGSGRLGVRSSGGGGGDMPMSFTYAPSFTGTQKELEEFRNIYAKDKATFFYQVVEAVRTGRKTRML